MMTQSPSNGNNNINNNPWSIFSCDLGNINIKNIQNNKEEEENINNNNKLDYSFLSSSLPLNFTKAAHLIYCGICKVVIIKQRYKQHHVDRHSSNDSESIMIPFEENVSVEDKTVKIKKIKRNRKKRANFTEKIKYSIDLLEKKKCKKVKIRQVNKRHHSKSFLDSSSYFSNTKKLKLDENVINVDKKCFFVTDEGFMSSSPKLLDDHFYHDTLIKKNNSSFDVFCHNDGVYCSNDSVNRTSSDSSTPPSLSLGTIQTLSSPSSLNILNDPSSVVTEHYFLPSNDLTPERSGVSCKYQIDSLPWENFTSVSNKEEDYSAYSIKDTYTTFDLTLDEGDGEVERAVQSITNLYEGSQIMDLAAINKRVLCNGFIESSNSKEESVSNCEDSSQQKMDIFNSDEASMIDCFLDEVLGSTINNKDHLSDFGTCSTNVQPSVRVQNNNNHLDSLMMDECNNLTEYQIDSNLLNSFSTEYDEKFETLINNAMNEFVTQSPQNICSANSSIDKKKSFDCFDPLKHCGVVAVNGVFCHRSLLCKLHTMPQKRQVERPESLTSLIKGIRDFNKTKRLHKKQQAQSSNAFKSSNSSKTSSDSINYNCSSTRSTEEARSFLENRLSTPDLDLSVLNNIPEVGAQPITISSSYFDPKPLVKSRVQQETVINGNRCLVATKSLLWRNRPKSKCHSLRFQQFSSSQNVLGKNNSLSNECQNAITLPVISLNNISINNSHDISLSETYKSHFGLPGMSNKTKVDAAVNNIAVEEQQINNIHNNSQMFTNNCNTSTNGQQNSRIQSNTVIYPPQDIQNTSTNLFVSNSDLTSSTNSLNLSSSTITNISGMSPGFFTSCNNQLLNLNHHFVTPNDNSSLNEVRLGSNMIFSDHHYVPQGGYSLANMPNNTIISDVSSSNNKFISILDEGSSSGSILYPVRNGNQIMMVMNKNNRVFNDNGELFNDNFVSVNQTSNVNQQLTSLPFLTLKQNGIQNMQQDGNTTLSTPQIVSISPLELQRFTDNFGVSLGGQLNSNNNQQQQQNNNEKGNSIIYQLNQAQPGNNFASSSLVSKVESNSNLAKPLTVQSSGINGLTQKFVILPDGTISAFTSPSSSQQQQQQQHNNIKTNFNQMRSSSIQHPIFNQLSNYGQNSQAYFINNDKIIIAPASATTAGGGTNGSGTGVAQQIIMPQIINQADINNHSSSALTFIHHSQHSQPSKISKINNNNNNNNSGRSAQNNLPTQIQADSSSQQKLSFQIQQTQNQYSNQIPNTFFITAAHPAAATNIPLKQQIFVQSSNEQLAQEMALMDSSGYFDGQSNSQNKSIDSDLRTISSSSQDFELVNHVLNTQPIIIQQSPVNRFSAKTIVQSNGCSSSLDISPSIEGALSTALANGQQHIVVNNNSSNELFAQSQLKFSNRSVGSSTSYFSGTSPNCTTLSGTGQNSVNNFKAGPPPLVISQQLLNQSVQPNQMRQKTFNDHAYQQQQHQKGSQLSQLVMDDGQFANEYMIVQSMIA